MMTNENPSRNLRLRDLLPAVLTVAACWLLSCQGGGSKVAAGGGEIGNPRTVSGIVVDRDNHPLGGMTISLLAKEKFNPVFLSTGDTVGKTLEEVHPVAQATTDQNGTYTMSFRTQVNDLALFGRSTDDSIMLYRSGVTLNSSDDVQLFDTARAAVVLTVGITDSLFRPDRFIYVKGTTIATILKTVGRMDFLVPKAVIDLSMYSPTDDSTVPTGQQFANVDASGSSRSVDVSARTHWISQPGIPSGSTQVSLQQQGNGISYAVSGARSNLYDTLAYQLDWGDSTMSSWIIPTSAGTAVTVSKFWIRIGTFTVTARARSVRDTSVISELSETLAVSVQ